MADSACSPIRLRPGGCTERIAWRGPQVGRARRSDGLLCAGSTARRSAFLVSAASGAASRAAPPVSACACQTRTSTGAGHVERDDDGTFVDKTALLGGVRRTSMDPAAVRGDMRQWRISGSRAASMKRTATLVKMARGPVVDERAPAESAQGRRITAAAWDVDQHEPALAPASRACRIRAPATW